MLLRPTVTAWSLLLTLLGFSFILNACTSSAKNASPAVDRYSYAAHEQASPKVETGQKGPLMNRELGESFQETLLFLPSIDNVKADGPQLSFLVKNPMSKISPIEVDRFIQESWVIQGLSQNELGLRISNRTSSKLELYFQLSVPGNAMIESFSFQIGDRRFRAVVREKAEAKRLYDLARQQNLNAIFITNDQEYFRFAELDSIEPMTMKMNWTQPLQLWHMNAESGEKVAMGARLPIAGLNYTYNVRNGGRSNFIATQFPGKVTVTAESNETIDQPGIQESRPMKSSYLTVRSIEPQTNEGPSGLILHHYTFLIMPFLNPKLARPLINFPDLKELPTTKEGQAKMIAGWSLLTESYPRIENYLKFWELKHSQAPASEKSKAALKAQILTDQTAFLMIDATRQ